MKTIGEILTRSEGNDNKIKEINGVVLTNREFDVVACLIHGRSIKKIASLFSVSPKTIEVYIRNVMLKSECNSREKIIDFIETSEKRLAIRKHYYSILEKNYFDTVLEKFKEIYVSKEEEAKIFCHSKSQKAHSLVNIVNDCLKKANVKVHRYSLEDQPPNNSGFSIYMVTSEAEREMLKTCLNKNKNSRGLILYLNMPSGAPLEQNCSNIFIDDDSSFYLMMLDLLNVFIPFKEVAKIREKILKEFCSMDNAMSSLTSETNNSLEGKLTADSIKNATSRSKLIFNNSFITFFSDREKNRLVFLVSILLLLTIVPSVFYQAFYKEFKYAQAALWLPSQEVFLKREDLLAKIDNVFRKDKNKIKRAIIVGMGGIGKTTIARHYAVHKNSNIFWEIDAESELAIIKSFERFAVALSKSKEEKDEIEHLYTLEDIDLLKTRLISFIQDRLRKNPDWLLLYDNAHNLQDVIQYLPYNESIWGAGKVLILTRNQNVADNKYINMNNVIQMPELTAEEKKSLFLKICRDKNRLDHKLLLKDKLETFLDKIPSFPLDVTAAAYFLKNVKLDYNEYLDHINNHGFVFRSFDEKLLVDVDNSFKARYNIVANTIQNIIEGNVNFRKKLLEISLLDPSGIPLELLQDDDKDEAALCLIRELSKYSLVNYNKGFTNFNISVHKSIHNIINLSLKDYIASNNGIKQIKHLNNKITCKLEAALNREDIDNIKIIVSQAEEFTKNVEQCINTEIDRLNYQIGRAYRYLGRFKDSIAILESIKNFEANIDILLELGTTYKNVGNYKKSVSLIEKALQISKQVYGMDSIQTARVEIRLDTPYRKLKKYKEAKKHLEHSLKVYERCKNIDLGDMAWIYTKLGHINVKLGNLEAGIGFLKKSLKLQLELYGRNNIRTAWTYVRMANAYKELNENKTAQNMLENSLRIYEKHYGRNHTKTAWVLCSLGEIEGLLGHFKQAEKHLNEGLKIQKQYYGENSVRLAWAFNKLAELYKQANMSYKYNYYFTLKSKALSELSAEKP